jgi:4-carboxymuconolactone decarboxylase
MTMSRPARARVEPDPEVLAANRGRNAANMLGTLGLNPEFARSFQVMAGSIIDGATTSRRQRGLVILRTGWNCGSQYLFGQHTLLGREIGITEEEIVAVTRPLTTHPWADDDRAVLALADDLYTDFSVTDQTWAELAARWSPKEIMEFVMTVGFYFMACGIHHTFGVQLDEGVPGWPNVVPA